MKKQRQMSFLSVSTRHCAQVYFLNLFAHHGRCVARRLVAQARIFGAIRNSTNISAWDLASTIQRTSSFIVNALSVISGPDYQQWEQVSSRSSAARTYSCSRSAGPDSSKTERCTRLVSTRLCKQTGSNRCPSFVESQREVTSLCCLESAPTQRDTRDRRDYKLCLPS